MGLREEHTSKNGDKALENRGGEETEGNGIYDRSQEVDRRRGEEKVREARQGEIAPEPR